MKGASEFQEIIYQMLKYTYFWFHDVIYFLVLCVVSDLIAVKSKFSHFWTHGLSYSTKETEVCPGSKWWAWLKWEGIIEKYKDDTYVGLSWISDWEIEIWTSSQEIFAVNS